MRATLTFSAAVTLGIAVGGIMAPLSRAEAADTPNADQIINSLTPGTSGPIATRGIRLGGQPPATVKSSTDASTGGMMPPVAKPPEANLTVPFASGSAMISPAAARVLDQLGVALVSPKLADFKFRVEGHTDTVGLPETNKVLSEQRAARHRSRQADSGWHGRGRASDRNRAAGSELGEPAGAGGQPGTLKLLVAGLGRISRFREVRVDVAIRFDEPAMTAGMKVKRKGGW
jgi:OmpA-OmpF porin, OOP family